MNRLVPSRWRAVVENFSIALVMVALFYALQKVPYWWLQFLSGTLVAVGVMSLEKILCDRRGAHARTDGPVVTKVAILAFAAALCFGGAIAAPTGWPSIAILLLCIAVHGLAGRLYYPEWPYCIAGVNGGHE